MKKSENLEIYLAVAILLIIYIGFVGHTLHNNFKAVDDFEETFIETPIVAEGEIRG
jgi:hypothetical protein